MKLGLRILLALFIGVVVFGCVHTFFGQLSSRWALLAATLTSIFSFVGEAFDFIKKVLEVQKLRREVEKLGNEAKKQKDTQLDDQRLVQPATPDEVGKYARSYTERRLTAHYELEEEKERVAVKSFIKKATSEKR